MSQAPSRVIFRAGMIWTVAGFAAGGLAWAIAAFLPGGISWPALTAGWLVAVANALAAWLINRRAVGANSWAFIRWGIAGNILRMGTLLGIILSFLFVYKSVRGSFFASVFAGFIVFMVVEIADLTRIDAGNRETS